MDSKTIHHNLETIKNPTTMKSIFSRMDLFGNDFVVTDVEVKSLKEFKTNASYTTTIVYNVTLHDAQGSTMLKKVLGSASSRSIHKYTFDMAEQIWDDVVRISHIPRLYKIYGFIDEYGLFLRDYLPGDSLCDLIVDKGYLDEEMSKKIANLIAQFQKIKIPKGVKPMINFHYLEYNIETLKKRDNKEIVKIEERANKLKYKITEWHNECNHVLVHGDLNPFNIIIQNSYPGVIDLDDSFRGDYLIDAAEFVSHIKALSSRGISEEACRISKDNFIKSYQELRGKFTDQEKDRFDTYVDYQDHFILIHKMVWGG